MNPQMILLIVCPVGLIEPTNISVIRRNPHTHDRLRLRRLEAPGPREGTEVEERAEEEEEERAEEEDEEGRGGEGG